jgi:hypothetical protein
MRACRVSLVEHSYLLALLGKSSWATQSTIGNPQLAVHIIRYVPEAGLYALQRLVVYEDEESYLRGL